MEVFRIFSLILVTLLAMNSSFGQVPVPVGSGSYASYPLAEELQFVWEGDTFYHDYNFVYHDPIYVLDGETRPIPTNDWWSNILLEKYGGLLFAYPLVMQPTEEGVVIQYPIGFNATGTDLERGNGLLISGENYSPDKAIAKDWTDWSLIMGMPDSQNVANMDITMTHGVPFTHIEVDGFNPQISATGGATYLNADGSPVDFPTADGADFVISSEGRLFGVHLQDNSNANIVGQQFIAVDLGQQYSLTSIELNWETAFASGYIIQVSSDNTNWTTVHSITDGDGGIDTHLLANTSRYVRILLKEKGTIYEYSLFEIGIFENATNVALDKSVTASSQEGGFLPDFSVDGDVNTRWASAPGEQESLIINMDIPDQEYITVDMGQQFALTSIELNWETAFASSYLVQVSNDNTNWTTIHSITDGDGSLDTHALANTCRYVRMVLKEQGTIYEYSLFEISIFENATNVALNKNVMASSQEGPFAPEFAVDGDMNTRWAAAPCSQGFSDQQYIIIDLGQQYTLTSLELNWETAFASGYLVQVSDDNTNWTTVHSVTDGDGGIDMHALASNSQYVRIALEEKGTIYEYSLFEISIFQNATNVALNKSVTVSSQEGAYAPEFAVDGDMNTRWAAGPCVQPMNNDQDNGHLVISALTQLSDLSLFSTYAHNKPIDTYVDYQYDDQGGTLSTTWNITTENLHGGNGGATLQGFIPHQYKNTVSSNTYFTNFSYVTSRGELKMATGNSFSFTYNFGGLIPTYNRPYKNINDDNPYSAEELYGLVSEFAAHKTGYGADTYWGGKDLVNIAKYAVLAKELNHQSFESLKALSKESLEDWLTYTPGETENYFARYDRWKALVGFNQSYGSAQFTDNHFHYGYLIYAASLYGMLDQDFLVEYGDMLKLICQQYANWNREDDFLPYLRTFDPWIGHSYAGGTSSGGGNNQESTSEAMQSWIGMFLLGEMLGDDGMRDAGAFGYSSESAATLEYWFDWDEENLPAAYAHNVVGILWNGGFSYGTYFSASPVHIHGIQYLPANPGFKYLAKNRTWADREYNDMMSESLEVDGHTSEIDFGDDWAHVALGFKLLFNPQYVSDFIGSNLNLGDGHPDYIMDYEVSGMTYHYAHAMQNLGYFSFNHHTDFPISSVFVDEQGDFNYAVAFNPADSNRTCTIYSNSGQIEGTFVVPPGTLVTYPELPDIGQEPENCYSLSGTATASSGNSSANAAIDGDLGSRWIANTTNPCTFDLDLGMLCSVNEIVVHWETANAQAYSVLGSVDSVNWTTIDTLDNLSLGERVDTIHEIAGDYRYLRLSLVTPNTVYPFSIFEIDVCGEVAPLPDTVLEQSDKLDNSFLLGDTMFTPFNNERSLVSQLTGDLNLLVQPNPSTGPMRIRISLPKEGPTYLRLLDFQGRELVRLLDGRSLDKGLHDFDLLSNGLQPGVYVIQLRTQAGILSKKIVVATGGR